jgi:hypothetical protein
MLPASDNSTTYFYVFEQILKLSRYHDGGGASRIARASDGTTNQGLANPIEMCESFQPTFATGVFKSLNNYVKRSMMQ